jgi:hypothetical protein
VPGPTAAPQGDVGGGVGIAFGVYGAAMVIGICHAGAVSADPMGNAFSIVGAWELVAMIVCIVAGVLCLRGRHRGVGTGLLIGAAVGALVMPGCDVVVCVGLVDLRR